MKIKNKQDPTTKRNISFLAEKVSLLNAVQTQEQMLRI